MCKFSQLGSITSSLIMNQEILGYRKTGKDTWSPIVQRRGGIRTAAVLMCGDCHRIMSGSGGPGNRNTLCPTCFDKFKLVNFAEGKDPVNGRIDD
jgi:hypothetical protein